MTELPPLAESPRMVRPEPWGGPGGHHRSRTTLAELRDRLAAGQAAEMLGDAEEALLAEIGLVHTRRAAGLSGVSGAVPGPVVEPTGPRPGGRHARHGVDGGSIVFGTTEIGATVAHRVERPRLRPVETGTAAERDAAAADEWRRCQELIELHVAACWQLRPPSDQLIAWLLRLQLMTDGGTGLDLTGYAALLGPAGLGTYRRAVIARWEQLPTIGLGEVARPDPERRALQTLLQEIAEQTADVDLAVLVLTKDLSSAWRYVTVAAALSEADRPDQALDWVERGLRAVTAPDGRARLLQIACSVHQRVSLNPEVRAAQPYARAHRLLERVRELHESYGARAAFERYHDERRDGSGGLESMIDRLRRLV